MHLTHLHVRMHIKPIDHAARLLSLPVLVEFFRIQKCMSVYYEVDVFPSNLLLVDCFVMDVAS